MQQGFDKCAYSVVTLGYSIPAAYDCCQQCVRDDGLGMPRCTAIVGGRNENRPNMQLRHTRTAAETCRVATTTTTTNTNITCTTTSTTTITTTPQWTQHIYIVGEI